MKKTNFLSKAAVFFAVMILFTAAQQVRAQTTYTVDTTADNENLNACTSAPNDCSLKGALAKTKFGYFVIDFAFSSDDAGCTADGVCTITLYGLLIIDTLGNGSDSGVKIINSTGPDKLIISGNNGPVFHNKNQVLTIEGITITDGNGANYGNIIAGGITNGGNLTLRNCVVKNNSSLYGTSNGYSGSAGGISNQGHAGIYDSTISGNNGASGGGIASSGSLYIARSTISGNKATDGYSDGGGIKLIGNGSARINNSTVSGNTASRGAGVYMSRANPSATSPPLTLSNSTVTDNTATSTYGSSAGIYTVYTDPAYQGQSIPIFLSSTIVAGNRLPLSNIGAPDIYAQMSAGSAYNLIGNGNGLTNNSGQSNNQIGTAANPIDPLLAPLADNGGLTETHALLPGSPAIDQGLKDNSSFSTDQRGLIRMVDQPSVTNAADGTDIGAFEALATSCPAITLSPSSLPNGAVAFSYNQTVSASGGNGSYTFSVTNGFLPYGLSLNQSSGVISGTPDSHGSFNFTVTAKDYNGCSGAQAYTVKIIFNPPSNLQAESVGATFVKLRWTDNTKNEIGFVIQICGDTNCRSGAQYRQAGANATTFTVTQLSANTQYVFRVAAVNSAGERSAFSNYITVKTLIR